MKKDILFGVWAIIAIALITFFVLIVMNNASPVGAYTATTAFLQYEPKEMCELNNCELYVSDNVNIPVHLRAGLTTSVNCLCQGQIKTFQLRQPNLGVYNPGYYP